MPLPGVCFRAGAENARPQTVKILMKPAFMATRLAKNFLCLLPPLFYGGSHSLRGGRTLQGNELQPGRSHQPGPGQDTSSLGASVSSPLK